MKTFLVFSIILAMASSLQAEPPDDAAASKLLIGSWTLPKELTTSFALKGGFTFKSKGTFMSYGVFFIDGKRVRINVEGTWTISNGVLVEKITKSSHPTIPPVGLITRDTLITVNEKEYRFRTEDGQIRNYLRVVDEKNM